MAKNGYTEEMLKNMGLVEVKPGVYEPVNKGKTSPFIESVKNPLIVREKVVETPDFTAKVKTEWFIKGNVIPKKNSRINFVKNGRQISIPSKAHKEYVTQTKMQYQVFGIEFRNAVKTLGLEYPLMVQFSFIRKSKHRSDFTNLVQTCEDLMTEYGWIEDDDLLHLLPFPAPVEFDKQNCGVKIKLLVK